MADIADVQVFLAGFDAGEQYASGLADSPPHSNPNEQHSQQQPLESSDTTIP
jgi:hypothetical protein